MDEYFADLHVHIGCDSGGERVKVTASAKLTFHSIMHEALENKGLDLIGIVDAASPPVMEDIRDLLEGGVLTPLEGGGFLFRGRTAVIPGCELAVRERGGQAHFLSYFPDLNSIRRCASHLDRYITNPRLSTQQTGLRAGELMELVLECGGIFMPAHAFTPHRSLYGSLTASLHELFSPAQCRRLAGLELGLSADVGLADRLEELRGLSFLSNSDAHSLDRIGREHNLLRGEPSFDGLVMVLENRCECRVEKNYGLDPRLGKYHRTFCPECEITINDPRPALECPCCDNQDVVIGVLDRVLYLAEGAVSGGETARGGGDSLSDSGLEEKHRAEYVHQLPLEFIPGVGKRTVERLLGAFGTEMNVLHRVCREDLARVVGSQLAERIAAGREGRLRIIPGGGGAYGRVTGEVLEPGESR